jgi:predicted CXXCH cytochrome family protein
MKKILFAFYAVIIMGLITVSPAIAGPGDGIAGSEHDFTSSGWQTRPDGDGTIGLCEVCHTPHSDSSKPILWNKDLTSGGSYDNTLQTAFLTSWGTPDGATLLCLSCHDGTIALDNYGGLTGGTNFIDAEARIGDGSTLAGNHPVSIPYTSSLIGTELKTVASVEATNLRLYGNPGSERIQCGSCHDVHNKQAVTTQFLRESRNSLCVGCHDK